ncbi:MAG: hypothetical protein M3422_11740 [Actinomycetota bacterium]|nr:hypothetical protein [Actinomycetota bacterium]
MAHWLQTSVLPAAIAAAVLLLVLWPTEHSGRRLLQTWGIPRPNPAQIHAAVRYLRQRRVLYVVLFLVFPPLAGLVDPDIDRLPGIGIFVPLLVAMLVAELIATLRPVSGVRTASLDRRSWRDLVPRWAVHTTAAAAIVTVVLAVAGIVAGPGTAWLALGYVVACLLVVSLLVALAVRRPSVSDEAVDAALRTRTARVAVGIGFGWLGTALTVATGHLRSLVVFRSDHAGLGYLVHALDVADLVVIAGTIVCWLWVAVPSRRSLAAAR